MEKIIDENKQGEALLTINKEGNNVNCLLKVMVVK